jgi:hypothetical protein
MSIYKLFFLSFHDSVTKIKESEKYMETFGKVFNLFY